MRVGALPRPFYRLARHVPAELTPAARDRLRWLQEWQALRAQLSGVQAAAVMGIPRANLYRWQRRLNRAGPRGLLDHSRRPHRPRQPTWTPQLVGAVQALREQYPRWGKDKLVILVQRQGWRASTSMVGRILRHLRQRGVLHEPPRTCRVLRRRPPRPYAVRKPKDYRPLRPGDLVEIDTMDVRPLPGVVLKHFTARDVISRWDVLEARTTATSASAAAMLQRLLERMPFRIRAIQVDGGSEFQAHFEEACRRLKLSLFVLPPRSPKLNGHVERAHRTHAEEFYDLYEGQFELQPLNEALRAWEWTYNTLRPHQALGGQTPMEYLLSRHSIGPPRPALSHM
jgi:putative transposase